MDTKSEDAIEYLMAQGVGSSFSEVVRRSLQANAEAHRRKALLAEAIETRENSTDRDAAQQLAAELAEISVW